MNRTYDLDPDLIEWIDAKARQLEVWQSDLVDYMLSYTKEHVDAGTLKIPVRPKVYSIDRSG